MTSHRLVSTIMYNSMQGIIVIYHLPKSKTSPSEAFINNRLSICGRNDRDFETITHERHSQNILLEARDYIDDSHALLGHCDQLTTH